MRLNLPMPTPTAKEHPSRRPGPDLQGLQSAVVHAKEEPGVPVAKTYLRRYFGGAAKGMSTYGLPHRIAAQVFRV